MVLAASSSEVVNAALLPSSNSPEDIRVRGEKGGEPPHIVFASDQSTEELKSMLSEPEVVADLIELKAGIALALPDLTADRASLVRELKRDGIPVDCLAHAPTQGYYLNASNGRQAEGQFSDFEKWTTANDLRWAEIGLDIEPNIQDFATFLLRSSPDRDLSFLGTSPGDL